MASEDHHSHDHHHHDDVHHHHPHDHVHEEARGDSETAPSSWVGPDGRVYHSHDGLAPHSHEPIYSPGYFSSRAPPLFTRDFNERAFTVGIGGPVGTGYFTNFFRFSSCYYALYWYHHILVKSFSSC